MPDAIIEKKGSFTQITDEQKFKYLKLILIASFIIRFGYIFYNTDYKNYLFSDMGGYWDRANGTYNGDIFSMYQWTSWATFFHMYLIFIFKILAFLNMSDQKLEVILFLNICYSVLSVYFVFLIANKLLKENLITLIVTLVYAFTYPLIYYNSLVLSENLSIPLLIISTYFLFAYHESSPIMFINGLLLGLAIGFRPALGLLGLPYFIYLLHVEGRSTKALIKGLLFTAGVFSVILLIILENNYISHGELKSLAGNSGVNFFIAQCKPSVVKSFYKEINIYIASPIFVRSGEMGEFTTDHPMHDQKYFFNLGMECIKKNPWMLVTNLKYYKGMFFGPLFPSIPSAGGFDSLIKLSNWFIFLISTGAGLMYFLIKKKIFESKEILFLSSIPLVLIATMYFFSIEQRYFFPALFYVYMMLAFIILNRQKIKEYITSYVKIIVIAYFICLFLC